MSATDAQGAPGQPSVLRRRILLDLHVPDWDPRFLAQHDPQAYVSTFAAAGAEEITFYAQSHLGLCNWPTTVGQTHANLGGRDLVQEAIDAIHAAGLRARAYYSVVHNNWAYQSHRDWRTTVPLRTDGGYPGPRYGLVCPNNPAYRRLAFDQVGELVDRYRFEALFIDLTFFTPVCQCASCADRFDAAGLGAPEPVADWSNPRWVRQRRAVERWAVEFAADLRSLVKAAQPDLSLQHNFTVLCGPTFGAPLSALDTVDLPAADFYGDLEEQIAVGRIFRLLAAGQPAEFMTSVSKHVVDGVSVKSADEMAVTAGLAAALGGGLTFIDAVQPSGAVADAPYRAVKPALALLARHSSDAVLTPVADIAVYYSENSRLDPRDNGRSSAEITWGGLAYPHFAAVKAACGHLQRAGLPYDVVVTGSALDGYAVIVLPDAIDLSPAERAALTEYVRAGGRLYASGESGRWDTEDPGPDAWGLDELFGISRLARDWYGERIAAGRPLDGVTSFHAGKPAFIRPRAPFLAAAMDPASHLSVTAASFVRTAVTAGPDTELLASVDLAWGDAWGSVFEHTWSSVHHDPPWRELSDAAVTRRLIGQGQVVYSLAALETTKYGEPCFVALTRFLLGDDAHFTVQAPSQVWVFVDDEGAGRRRVALVDVSPEPVARRQSTVEIALNDGSYELDEVVAEGGIDEPQLQQHAGRTTLTVRLDQRITSVWLSRRDEDTDAVNQNGEDSGEIDR